MTYSWYDSNQKPAMSGVTFTLGGFTRFNIINKTKRRKMDDIRIKRIMKKIKHVVPVMTQMRFASFPGKEPLKDILLEFIPKYTKILVTDDYMLVHNSEEFYLYDLINFQNSSPYPRKHMLFIRNNKRIAQNIAQVRFFLAGSCKDEDLHIVVIIRGREKRLFLS